MPAESHRAARPTLAAIATRAGTSIPTASKALRGGTDVAPATRERIIRAAEQLGYRRVSDDAARGGSNDASPGLVDFVLESVESTWANRALGGVEAAASEADVDVVITLARDGSDWVDRVLRRSSMGAVLAVVGPTPGQWRRLAEARLPVVLLDPKMPPPRSVASVGAMNWQGGRSAAEHLLTWVTPASLSSMCRIRTNTAERVWTASVSALAAAGIELDAHRLAHAGWDRSVARSAAMTMFEGADAPTAVFTCTESLALGVYDAAAELGLSIPGDVSVVGYDDLPEAGWANPPMTTVQQPIAEMGAAALRMLMRLRAAPESGAERIPREELATRLIVRSSTGPPPA